MILKFQLNNLSKSPQNWKLKYILDHLQEPITKLIKRIKDKENIMKLFYENRKYDNIIEKHANENEVDSLLIKSIIYQESRFNPNAHSWAGAGGLMQLTAETAKSLWVNDVYNPEQNIKWGTKYISKLIKKYMWNIPLALAAYNAGPWNVSKYWNKIPPFKETKNYVKNIMHMYNTIKN